MDINRKDEQKRTDSIFDSSDAEEKDEKKKIKGDGIIATTLGIFGVLYGLAAWIFKGTPLVLLLGVALLVVGIIRINSNLKKDKDYYDQTGKSKRERDQELLTEIIEGLEAELLIAKEEYESQMRSGTTKNMVEANLEISRLERELEKVRAELKRVSL